MDVDSSRRDNRPSFAFPAWVVLLLLACGACSRTQLGFPRTAIDAPSPDRSIVAIVKNRPAFDPPNQSLWLKTAGREIFLKQLAEDADWCSEITWSGDGKHVAFLIRDSYVLIYRSDGTKESERYLVTRDGNYLQPFVARNIAILNDRVQFQLCERTSDYKGLKQGSCRQADSVWR
jgi:hypothetical protein